MDTTVQGGRGAHHPASAQGSRTQAGGNQWGRPSRNRDHTPGQNDAVAPRNPNWRPRPYPAAEQLPPRTYRGRPELQAGVRGGQRGGSDATEGEIQQDERYEPSAATGPYGGGDVRNEVLDRVPQGSDRTGPAVCIECGSTVEPLVLCECLNARALWGARYIEMERTLGTLRTITAQEAHDKQARKAAKRKGGTKPRALGEGAEHKTADPMTPGDPSWAGRIVEKIRKNVRRRLGYGSTSMEATLDTGRAPACAVTRNPPTVTSPVYDEEVNILHDEDTKGRGGRQGRNRARTLREWVRRRWTACSVGQVAPVLTQEKRETTTPEQENKRRHAWWRAHRGSRKQLPKARAVGEANEPNAGNPPAPPGHAPATPLQQVFLPTHPPLQAGPSGPPGPHQYPTPPGFPNTMTGPGFQPHQPGYQGATFPPFPPPPYGANQAQTTPTFPTLHTVSSNMYGGTPPSGLQNPSPWQGSPQPPQTGQWNQGNGGGQEPAELRALARSEEHVRYDPGATKDTQQGSTHITANLPRYIKYVMSGTKALTEHYALQFVYRSVTASIRHRLQLHADTWTPALGVTRMNHVMALLREQSPYVGTEATQYREEFDKVRMTGTLGPFLHAWIHARQSLAEATGAIQLPTGTEVRQHALARMTPALARAWRARYFQLSVKEDIGEKEFWDSIKEVNNYAPELQQQVAFQTFADDRPRVTPQRTRREDTPGPEARVTPTMGSPHNREGGCFSCGEPGHIARDCPDRQTTRQVTCYLCGEPGHISRNCPDRERQYSRSRSPARGRSRDYEHERSGDRYERQAPREPREYDSRAPREYDSRASTYRSRTTEGRDRGRNRNRSQDRNPRGRSASEPRQAKPGEARLEERLRLMEMFMKTQIRAGGEGPDTNAANPTRPAGADSSAQGGGTPTSQSEAEKVWLRTLP